MKKQTALLALTTSIFASYSVAGTMGPVVAKDWTWVSSVSVGPAWARAGDTQTFSLRPKLKKPMSPENRPKPWLSLSYFLAPKRTCLINGLVNWGLNLPLPVVSGCKVTYGMTRIPHLTITPIAIRLNTTVLPQKANYCSIKAIL